MPRPRWHFTGVAAGASASAASDPPNLVFRWEQNFDGAAEVSHGPEVAAEDGVQASPALADPGQGLNRRIAGVYPGGVPVRPDFPQ